ncbi:terpene cyclase/mutase family protein [PVC group bacterium]|nr:terpene cyclase/mutase family protein [PVC group bacterium]
MTDESVPKDLLDDLEQLEKAHHHDLLELFEELTFREKWSRVAEGLKQPPETGAYKWARLQMIRLISPAAAVVVPILVFVLIAVFAALAPKQTRSVEVKIIEPESIEDLEDIEDPIEEPLEPPDPVMDFTTTDPNLIPDAVAAPPADFSPQPVEFDAVAMTKSPVIMKGIYGSRNPGAKGEAMARYGGLGTEASVMRALRWIKRNQLADGSWNECKPAMTALALLAYLAHGDTPASEEFGSTVEGAIRFLIESQTPSGRFRGRDGSDYTQPIAAYALAETFGLTKVPQVREAAVNSLRLIIKGQNPTGGFNYNLKPTSARDDTSYMGWCVQALKAAKMAGLSMEFLDFDTVWKKSIAGFQKNYGEQDGIGGFGYCGKGGGGSRLTGVGVLCLQFLGASRSPECRGGVRGLSKAVCTWNNIPKTLSQSPVYYWYYITQAKFHEGGATWNNWNQQFSPTLVKNQKIISKEQSGYVDHLGKPQETGFWTSPGTREHNGGNNEMMDTILCCLMLEVYYRYLPTFKPPKFETGGDIADKQRDIEIDIF